MKIAILGYGTVGRGVHEIAEGLPELHVKRILHRREVPELGDLLTLHPEDIMNDPDIGIVAECIGGTDIARTYVLEALRAGKHVVTPNKNLIAAHYDELCRCAEEHGVTIRFTASAGGGIPWLYNLRRQARADRITAVEGILNGTCNYILDAMHREGRSFESVLHEAQELGYAESDPSSDIDGLDTLHKCAISTRTAFGIPVSESELPVFGIRTVTDEDISYFKEKHLVCKLFLQACLTEKGYTAYVCPVLLPEDDLAAHVPSNNNLISLTGDYSGKLSFYGQGAGAHPTGLSVIEDLLDTAYEARIDETLYREQNVPLDLESVKHRYYLREDGQDAFITAPLSLAELTAMLQGKGPRTFFAAEMRE